MSLPCFPIRPIAAASVFSFLGALPCLPAHAQGVATEAQLETVVQGTRAALSPTLPSNTASKTAADLKKQNLFNPEDALEQLPGLTIRKRYFGDRNANVGGRSHGTLQPGRSLVYVDGYLISNFLGRFDAPRWNMVNTEAVERVDAIYGPFSAIYPGNSIGTTVIVTERKPKGFEAAVSLKYHQQPFDEYGTKETYQGTMLSTRLASRADSGLWWVLGFQHQDSQGHPMGYANTTQGTSGQFTAPTGTQVSCILYDVDPLGRTRAIFGATSIDHTRQDTLNLRLGYDISRTQEVEGRISLWRNQSDVQTRTYLRDAAGQAIWSGAVNDGQYGFQLTPASFAPSQREEDHRQLGLTWKTRHARGWNASVVATDYQILTDADRTSNAPPGTSQPDAGRVTRRDGTGWNTLELQTTYTPTPDDWTGGRHALTLGLHRNQYTLDNVVNKTGSDWVNGETSNDHDQFYKGMTTITALYAQDAWRLHEDWLLTSGLRWESFRSSDGSQYFSGVPTQPFADRKITALSPKLSLSWSARDDLMLKASAGRGVRFPNVDELFNGTKTGTSITVSDPNLKPESSNALELSGEKFWPGQSLRLAYFRDDSRNTILRQSNQVMGNTGATTITRISNVDRVLTDGLEVVWQARDVLMPRLDVTAHATWANSKVKQNRLNPATEGMNWPRIPKQRYGLQADYRVSDAWSVSGAWRWHGRSYNTDLNNDINPDVFGGVSRVNKLDLRTTWRFAPHWEWAFGMDNVTNDQAYQAHSLPQRSFHTSLSYSLK